MMAVAAVPDRRASLDGTAVSLMLLLTLSWGLNQVLIKIAGTGFNPIAVAAGRSALGALLVYGWCLWRRVPIFERDGTLVAGILAGVLFGAEFALIFFALDFTTVARGTLMINTMPFWVLVGAHFLLGERMNARKVAGLVLAFIGVALIFSDKLSLPDARALTGDVLMLAAAALWGATTLVIRRSSLANARAEKTLLYQLVVSVFVVLPLIPLAGPLLREPSTAAVVSFLVQAVYVTGFTYMLWFSMMTVYPASDLSSFTFLSPVFGVLGGAILLDEPWSWRIVVALVVIAVGLVIVNRPARINPAA